MSVSYKRRKKNILLTRKIISAIPEKDRTPSDEQFLLRKLPEDQVKLVVDKYITNHGE